MVARLRDWHGCGDCQNYLLVLVVLFIQNAQGLGPLKVACRAKIIWRGKMRILQLFADKTSESLAGRAVLRC